eukprot:CAMPEP_0180482404 /NCGR_PEP_ID=MMETSP1036_2-20121128/34878_1 /TAXON_ID=632150 /ORGANISM="Azadinium spinosum, Strain 3D9" /LENGTH=215 /DNA_ID=CAMNT_0022490157 /DNA_START=27 /DNA_END=674 /DNA_ORIENTATION=+
MTKRMKKRLKYNAKHGKAASSQESASPAANAGSAGKAVRGVGDEVVTRKDRQKGGGKGSQGGKAIKTLKGVKAGGSNAADRAAVVDIRRNRSLDDHDEDYDERSAPWTLGGFERSLDSDSDVEKRGKEERYLGARARRTAGISGNPKKRKKKEGAAHVTKSQRREKRAEKDAENADKMNDKRKHGGKGGKGGGKGKGKGKGRKKGKGGGGKGRKK